LEVPEIRALFTPETPQDEVCRELPFELIERNTWWSGIVDRLVLRRHLDGTLGQAVIIDFKTDTVASSEALRTRYSDQVAIYRSAIGLALTLSESQVKTVLVSTHLKCVVELKKRNLKSELNLPMTPTRP
jgi:ATP-dependent exoDNAse (exonuclease V) beta subunit